MRAEDDGFVTPGIAIINSIRRFNRVVNTGPRQNIGSSYIFVEMISARNEERDICITMGG